jgi:hypothetical protein
MAAVVLLLASLAATRKVVRPPCVEHLVSMIVTRPWRQSEVVRRMLVLKGPSQADGGTVRVGRRLGMVGSTTEWVSCEKSYGFWQSLLFFRRQLSVMHWTTS